MAPSSSSPGAGAGVGVSPILPKPASGLIIASDFESKSHDELYAMVEHADVERTTLVAARLSSAAALLALLGDELKGHVSQVRWEGEAGEAFRVWGADMANATLRLGELSGSAGEWMAHAASTLSRVKSAMPKPSEARATLDAYRQANPERVGQVPSPLTTDQSGGLRTPGPTQRQAYEAQQAPAEAARLMRQLAESYAWSAHQLSVAPRPTFRPMPDSIASDPERERMRRVANSGFSGAPPAGAYSQTLSAPEAGMAAPRVPHEVADVLVPTSPARDRPAPSRLDATAISPPATPDSSGAVAIPRPDGPAPTPSAPLPPLTAPPVGSGERRPANPSSPGRTPGSGIGRIPLGPGANGSSGARAVAPLPRNVGDGIVGGHPSPRTGGQSNGRIPRGTAAGTEAGQRRQTSAPSGFGPASGAAVGATGRGQQGGPGRRLTTEPGGIVGGRPQQRGSASDRTFTPGGAGLVRPAGADERSPRNGRRQRPDYLSEEEANWTNGHRRTVPPVID